MRTPAVDAWRREVAAGQRTPATFDPLWRRACEDLTAAESGHHRHDEPDELLAAIRGEISVALDRCERTILSLEARAALADGNRNRAWWLRARAAAVGAP